MTTGLWHIVIDGILILSLMAGVWAYRGKAQEADDLHAALDASQERIEQLRYDMQLQADTLAEREAKISRLNAEKSRLNKKMSEIIQHDENAKNWASERIPDSISRMLKRKSGTADNSSAVANPVR